MGGKEEEKTTRFPYYGPCFRKKEQLQLLHLTHSLASCSFLRPKRGSQKREEGVGRLPPRDPLAVGGKRGLGAPGHVGESPLVPHPLILGFLLVSAP